MQGLFDLLSGDDLCAKLEHDYARVCANPADAYSAFDFVVTAWHLLEWRYPGDVAKGERATVRAKHPILQVCEQLAVGAKHFEPTDSRLQSVAGTLRDAVWAKGAWAQGAWAQGVWKDDLVVCLSGAAKQAFGAQLTIRELADLVVSFWRQDGGWPTTT